MFEKIDDTEREQGIISAAEQSQAKLKGARKAIITWLLGTAAIGLTGDAIYTMSQGNDPTLTNLAGIHEIYLAQHPEIKNTEDILKSNGMSGVENYDDYHLNAEEARLVAKEELQLGEGEVLDVLKDESVRSDAEREKKLADFHERVTGLETFQDSSTPEASAVFKDVMDMALPRGLVFNVRNIRYDPSLVSMSDNYGAALKREKVEEAHERNHMIIFTGGSDAEPVGFKLFAFFHEMFHANSWKENQLLTREERLRLLDKVTGRINAKDRYRSAYVEAIANPDKQEEAAVKCGEYLAEIGMAYTMGLPLPQEDAAIVRSVIEKTDPHFDVAAAHRLQMEILEKYPHEN